MGGSRGEKGSGAEQEQTSILGLRSKQSSALFTNNINLEKILSWIMYILLAMFVFDIYTFSEGGMLDFEYFPVISLGLTVLAIVKLIGGIGIYLRKPIGWIAAVFTLVNQAVGALFLLWMLASYTYKYWGKLSEDIFYTPESWIKTPLILAVSVGGFVFLMHPGFARIFKLSDRVSSATIGISLAFSIALYIIMS